jgi:hypothetical protein
MHSLTPVPEPSPPAYEEEDSLTTNLPTYTRMDVGKVDKGIISKTLGRALMGLTRGWQNATKPRPRADYDRESTQRPM